MDLKAKVFDQVAAARTGDKTVDEATNCIIMAFKIYLEERVISLQ